MYKRVPTGIKGFDEILHGGLPKDSVILISGSSGTGKTIFGTQFLIEGSMKYNETGLLVTLDQKPNKIRKNFSNMGWNLSKLEKEDKFVMLDAASPKIGMTSKEDYVVRFGLDVDSLYSDISKIVEEKNVDRMLIDSLPMIAFRSEADEIRTSIYRLMSMLGSLNCTSLVITEREGGSEKISRFGVEQYASTGVILLEMDIVGNELRRKILIKKLRGCNHSKKRYPFEISDNGIEVYSNPDFYNK